LNAKQIFGNTLVKENVLKHEANSENYVFIGLIKGGISFFTKHEKKGRCFFAEGSKMVLLGAFFCAEGPLSKNTFGRMICKQT
jgi:hypothetical protein